MSISSIGAQSALIMKQLVQMRAQFDDLQRQLATGHKSATYAGLGIDRGVTVSLNSQLSAISSYDDTIQNVMARINLMNTALGNMIDISSSVKAAMVQANGVSNGSGAEVAQQTGLNSLDQLLALLNARAGDRYLFSGRATDTPAVETLDHILNGNGSRAGLKQLINERNQADLGADGRGRLTIGAGGPNTVQIDEQVTTFGFKLGSITSNVTGATTSGPTGSPASMSIDFSSAVPNPGETVTVRLNLPESTFPRRCQIPEKRSRCGSICPMAPAKTSPSPPQPTLRLELTNSPSAPPSARRQPIFKRPLRRRSKISAPRR